MEHIFSFRGTTENLGTGLGKSVAGLGFLRSRFQKIMIKL
jgi:hypothetical protein